MKNTKVNLALGVASAAIAMGYSYPASAACTTSGSSVTCSDANTVGDVNTATGAVVGNALSLSIASGATVVQGGGTNVSPSQTGAVSVSNAGALGIVATPVGVSYLGDDTSTANTFDLTNTASGAITGNISISGVGGTSSVTNAGAISGSVFQQSIGAASLTSSGAIAGPVNVQSDADASATIGGTVGATGALQDVVVGSNTLDFATDTNTAGTVTTTTNTATLGGATGSVNVQAGGQVGDVFVSGGTAANATVAGAVGSSTQLASVTAIAVAGTLTETTTNDTGTNPSSSDTVVLTPTGGDAAITVAATGSVSGDALAMGLTSATVTNSGKVAGDVSAVSQVNATQDFSSSLVNSTSNTSSVTTGTAPNDTLTLSTSSSRADAVVGGDALVRNNAGATIGGNVQSLGLTSASLDNAGSIAGDVAVNATIVQSSDSASTTTVVADPSGAAQLLSYQTQSGSANSTLGGDASLANAAGATIGGGSGSDVSVVGLTSATLTNAGTIDANTSVAATGTDSASTRGFELERTYDASGNQIGQTTTRSLSLSRQATGGDASLTNAAGGLIGASQNDPVQVDVSADGNAAFANSGRVNGDVSVSAGATNGSFTVAFTSQSSADPVTGVTTTGSSVSGAISSQPVGGTASFANSVGGLVVGSVDLSGVGGATVTNAGVVTGTTDASSSASFFEGNGSFTSTSVFTPGADGGTVNDTALQGTLTTGTTGGDVTGTYSGVNGSVQFVPPYGYGTDGSVSQNAAGNSSATVSGTIYGNFDGSATSDTVTTTLLHATHQAYDASGNQFEGTDTRTSSTTSASTGGNSSLLVNGGKIAGSATLFADGDASAQLGNGASIGGDLTATSATNFSLYGANSTVDSSSSTVYAFDDSGNVIGSTSQSQTTGTYANGAGRASASFGKATVDGNLQLNGAKGGAQFDLAATGVVNGDVNVWASGQDFTYTDTSATTSGVSGTVTDTSHQYSYADNGGDVTGTAAGHVGGSLDVWTNGGNAALTLSGVVAGDVSVEAAGTTGSALYTQHSGPDGSVSTETSSVTDTGGTATLNVTAASLAKPANYGDIYVAGVNGSSATIGANSAVLAGYGSSMQVGDVYTAHTYTSTNTDPATGLASFTASQTDTTIGGPASLTNAGVIGDIGYNSADVLVTSVGGASATNSGRIYGDLSAVSLGSSVTTTQNDVNIGDATEVDTQVKDYVPLGGAATVANSGLVTGSVALAGATGTLTNGGVIRGDVNLGQSVDNYVTTSVDTLTQLGTETVTDVHAPFAQTYTVNQNGLVGGTIGVNGAFGPLADASGAPIQTSNIAATINLNSGSVTVGGVNAEYDPVTGARYTHTNVNLVGTGYLGLNSAGVAAEGSAFSAVDPDIAAEGSLAGYTGGARVLGVDTLSKTGAGTFTIVGSDYVPASSLHPVADYTLDLGQFAIAGGEVQLATENGGQFGIRGDLTNSASLVLGTRVTLPGTLFASSLTSTGVQGVDGVSLYEKGNFVQTGTGTLVVGMMPSLVRVVDPSVSSVVVSTEPLAVQQVLYSQGLFTTPQNAFGTAFASLSPSFATIDGNLTLNGKVSVLTPRGGLFVNGQSMDLFSVSGTVTENAAVDTGVANNFVTFDLVTRTVNGRKVVAVVASRAGYETAAANTNAAAAGAALTAALPQVVSQLQADAAGTATFTSVAQFQATQDLATVMAGLDTQLTRAQATQALNELAGGSYYGSLATVKTTAPFVDALTSRRLPEGARGFTLWLEPNGQFVRTDANSTTGAARLHADNYGVSGGLGLATGTGEFGIGFGYGRIDSHTGDDLAHAKANTYMIGAFAREEFGPLMVAADFVYGWSNWDASRSLPTLSRSATASFDSKEVRGDLRAEYRVPLGGAWVAPYGQLELRHYSFDGFDEVGAGSVSLSVKGASKTVVTPELGVKLGSEFQTGGGALRPEASIGYVFNTDQNAYRDVAFQGAPSQVFRLQGVDPKGYANMQLGLTAEIGNRASAFVRGAYATGGGYDTASIRAGVVIGF